MVRLFYSRASLVSTFRLVAVVAALAAGPGRAAEPPTFSQGGFIFALQYGPGFWLVNEAALGAQAGAGYANVFVSDLVTSHTLSLSAKYVILGHASIGVDFTATGWDVFSSNRGGAGFLVGTVGWHPLELVFKLLEYEKRPVTFDVSTWVGLGYGIAGERLGSDGLTVEWGVTFDWFFTRFFALGTFARGAFLKWNSLYLDFNNRDVPGNTVPLPNGLGGAFWTLGLSLTFRAGD
ncbi:MAG: hypothetical protein AB1730_08710 [Myxococcota bacterium]|jgi:hypothetical protein